MALRSVISQLSHKFTTSQPGWMRSISTSQVLRQVEKSEETVMPSVLKSELRTPPELSRSLEPYAGRSISLVTNPNSAYKRLSGILSRNNVRRELRDNRYYEKPHLARRRKAMERNRKLFGAMVGKKVALIMQMKQRGM